MLPGKNLAVYNLLLRVSALRIGYGYAQQCQECTSKRIRFTPPILALHFSSGFYMRRFETDMVICLSPTKYQLFLRRISRTSPARLALRRARKIDFHPSSKLTNRRLIVCDKSKATILRNAAREFCPEALPEIEIAFQHDRYYWM